MAGCETVRTISARQMRELAAALMPGIPGDLSSAEAQSLIGRKGWLVNEVERMLRRLPNYARMIEWWGVFYKEVFGTLVQLKPQIVPEEKAGLSRLLVMVKEVSLDQIVDYLAKATAVDTNFSSGHHRDVISPRVPPQHYAIWIRDRLEADCEHRGKSVEMISEEGLCGITLEERLMLEVVHLQRSNEQGFRHLDEGTQTLCTGSRTDRGSTEIPEGWVPVVGRSSGVLTIRYVDRIREKSIM
ncbi:hypothetical protein KKG41_00535, partial [Patescibacteria group bacterium]|nr:hypothetical protein [Patescibacteria group bacterium]